jgi:uncharacterized FlaG/YvyC family protein
MGNAPLGAEQMQELVERINQALRERLHDDRDVALALRGQNQETMVIEVREKQSGDLIMQFPPEALLEISERLAEYSGLIFDRKS